MDKEINKDVRWAYLYLKYKGYGNRANRLLNGYLKAKKEVFDDIEKFKHTNCEVKFGSGLKAKFKQSIYFDDTIQKIKKRHLSTFKKKAT